MGTRINYEIMMEDGSGPAVVLYSNGSHKDVDAEQIFVQLARRPYMGPSDLVLRLLLAKYASTSGNNRQDSPVFTIDLAPGDREKVIRVHYGERRGEDDIPRIEVLVTPPSLGM